MPFFAERVKDTTTSTGTGAITLDNAAPSGFRTFADATGGTPRYLVYCIAGGAEWEVGKGMFDGSTGLTRDVVRASSNAGNPVNFSAGSKDVFLTTTGEQIDNANFGLQYAMARGILQP